MSDLETRQRYGDACVVSLAMQRIDRAKETYQTELAKLERNDGRRFYSEEEHAERVATAAAAFSTSIEAIVSEASQQIDAAQAALDALANPDPFDQLSASDVIAANNRRPFVEEDCAGLPLPELLAMMRVVVRSGDKARAYLYSRYGRLRLGTEQAAGTGTLPNTLALIEVLNGLGALLVDPKLGDKTLAAQGTVKLYRDLRGHAERVRIDTLDVFGQKQAAQRLRMRS